MPLQIARSTFSVNGPSFEKESVWGFLLVCQSSSRLRGTKKSVSQVERVYPNISNRRTTYRLDWRAIVKLFINAGHIIKSTIIKAW